jgi:phage regulator Rha-like protein
MIKMNLVNIGSVSMTSQEIADLVDKRHDNVKRTIETLSDQGVIVRPQIEDGIKSANGVVPQHYRFTGEQGKRDSIIVVAQLSPEFTARLVDRWQDLERSVSPALPNFANPAEAARAWAAPEG